MPKASPPSSSRRPPVAEVEGFLAGLEHALGRLRTEGSPDPDSESELRRARDLLSKGDDRRAAEILEGIDDRLRSRRDESELTEFPRGLVGYVPRGARGSPPGPEEDPIWNRRRLVLRLVDLTPLPPEERDRALRELAAAEADLVAGDRRSARHRIDEAHRMVEAARSGA